MLPMPLRVPLQAPLSSFITATRADLSARGFSLGQLELPKSVRQAVLDRNWAELDRLIRIETLPAGCIFERLRGVEDFSDIEFIISIRSSRVEPDDDGIWHDDGSRVLAFTLSLTLQPEAISGGVLEIRRKEHEESGKIPTPSFGTIIVFATGHRGFEHKINRVAEGERVIIAGWCT